MPVISFYDCPEARGIQWGCKKSGWCLNKIGLLMDMAKADESGIYSHIIPAEQFEREEPYIREVKMECGKVGVGPDEDKADQN